MQNEQQRDQHLWETAKARVGFRWSLISYILVNSLLVAIWFFTSGNLNHFWPIWPMLGWGVGLGFQYARAYHGNQISSVEEEYEKLKNKKA